MGVFAVQPVALCGPSLFLLLLPRSERYKGTYVLASIQADQPSTSGDGSPTESSKERKKKSNTPSHPAKPTLLEPWSVNLCTIQALQATQPTGKRGRLSPWLAAPAEAGPPSAPVRHRLARSRESSEPPCDH